MPTAINPTVLIHLYEPPRPIGSGDRTGASFRGYHKTKVKNIQSKAWEDHFTSVSGSIWGKEAEWLLRDGVKGSMVLASGPAYVEKWTSEKNGPGAGLRIEATTARILDRKESGDDEPVQALAPAPSRPAPAPAAADDEPPF